MALASPLSADTIRVATFNVELSRDGPGVLLRDILKNEDADIRLSAEIIAQMKPDVLLITGFDFDHDGHALATFADLVAGHGHNLEHRFTSLPNTGIQSGSDLDGDGRLGGPRDAFGFGEFAGQGGMAVLSVHPIRNSDFRELTSLTWSSVPDALIDPSEYPNTRRLSSVGHWILPIDLPDGEIFDLLAWHATPPVFDGPEDLNGRRNHDEAAVWIRYLNGDLVEEPQSRAFVLIGDANLDPADGDGRNEAINALLSHPRVQDPEPKSAGGREDALADGGINVDHLGDPSLDTADWRDGPGDPGNLRVDYVLPSTDWRVLDAGVFWPAPDEPGRRLLGDDGNGASRHRLVWVDLMLER